MGRPYYSSAGVISLNGDHEAKDALLDKPLFDGPITFGGCRWMKATQDQVLRNHVVTFIRLCPSIGLLLGYVDDEHHFRYLLKIIVFSKKLLLLVIYFSLN